MTDTPAAYLRTSLEDFNRAHGLADQSQSISNQRKVILEYVQHNPEFSEVQIREFIDDGLTGTNTDRPQFQAMIEAARRGEVKCIIVKDLSRFGRNYLDVGDYLEHIFPFLGVRVIAVNDGYDSKQYEGKTGGMDIAFRNFMYENYSRDLSIKVRSAMHSRMKKGRVVIPKEIRRVMRIREGDPLEIYTDRDGSVIFKKYSLLGGVTEFAAQMCDTLNRTTGRTVVITDRDSTVAVAGAPRRELADQAISPELERLMEGRQIYQHKAGEAHIPLCAAPGRFSLDTAAPILSEGDVLGCVVFAAPEGAPEGGEVEYKLAQSAAAFLGRHMEG